MTIGLVRPLQSNDSAVIDDKGYIIGVKPASDRESRLAYFSQADGSTSYGLMTPDGGVAALSEAFDVVTLTATGTAFTGACEYRGFIVRAQTGGTADVTVYDALSATGTPIMTVANIVNGTYYMDGDHATVGNGTGGRRRNTTGLYVVIAGTCTIDVMVE